MPTFLNVLPKCSSRSEGPQKYVQTLPNPINCSNPRISANNFNNNSQSIIIPYIWAINFRKSIDLEASQRKYVLKKFIIPMC